MYSAKIIADYHMTSKQYARYKNTLDTYLKWNAGGKFLRPVFDDDADTTNRKSVPSGIGAAEAMYNWETHGTALPNSTTEPELLSDYVQGKQHRDWHITQWKQDCRGHWLFPDGIYIPPYFTAEELVGSLGLTENDFESIFGRKMGTMWEVETGEGQCTQQK